VAGIVLNALGDIGDFVSGIAVLITLAYLATQVRQYTAALRTASRQDLSSAYRSHNRHFLDPQVSEVYAIGLRNYPDMTPAEKRTFTYAISDHALFLQNAFALYESGSLGIENYTPYLTWFACAVATPGGSAWWHETKGFYNAALIESIDARLAKGGLPNALELGFFAIEE
jgi:hypothetical protein